MGIRDYLGRLGGAFMSLGAGGALAYLITSHAVGQPSAPLTWPAWPYWLCGGMFVVGALMLAGVQGWIGWLYRRIRHRNRVAAPSVPPAMPSATYDVIKLELAGPPDGRSGDEQRGSLISKSGSRTRHPAG